jgi:hypothetical protein
VTGRVLNVGPASMAGLVWLARVGPTPLDAWATAMRWSDRTARSHAARLERDELLRRCRMTVGDGALVWATGRGVRRTGVDAPRPDPPSATLWAHWAACGWVAAWLTVRDRDWLGQQELLNLDEWSDTVAWSERDRSRRVTHRPDLVVMPPASADSEQRRRVPVEVELTRKSDPRLTAIMQHYRRWRQTGHATGLLYVVDSDAMADRIADAAARAGVGVGVQRLDAIVEQTRDATTARG